MSSPRNYHLFKKRSASKSINPCALNVSNIDSSPISGYYGFVWYFPIIGRYNQNLTIICSMMVFILQMKLAYKMSLEKSRYLKILLNVMLKYFHLMKL